MMRENRMIFIKIPSIFLLSTRHCRFHKMWEFQGKLCNKNISMRCVSLRISSNICIYLVVFSTSVYNNGELTPKNMVDQIPSVCVCVCARENNICNKTISFVITTSQIMSIDKLRAEAQSASRGEVMYLEKK